MPTYEYRCETCDEIFERRERIAEHEVAEAEVPEMRKRKGHTGFLGLLRQDVEEELNGYRWRACC